MNTLDDTENRKLYYDIHKFSSYSTSYLPENIRDDCPSNQISRWSSNTNNPPQYLTLRLTRPAIVRKIKFGKHEKTHVCNLRKFKVLGGLEDDNLTVLFEGGLRNDSTPETFNLRHTTDTNDLFPVLYVQIMPLLSWGPSFNFSIWYVELLGEDDPLFLGTSLRKYNMLRELELVRLCLKHFRQQGYESAFQALQQDTNINLEHPMMSELHNALVNHGQFGKAEEYADRFINDGLMDAYLIKQDYKATWTRQEIINSEKRPGMRGGHQLIVDSSNSIMYLFGGWDGFEDLSDLWSYDIKKNTWTLIHERAEQFDGPAPRSCHKMLYDPCNSQIFTLGRYLDSDRRTTEYIQSDFYLYDTVAKTWLLICDDTSQVGGPQLVFDHQMCIDVSKRMIYVFGGRILTPRNIDDLNNDTHYSGLFSYHIGTNTWTQILVDCGHSSAANPDVYSIKSRVTHSMLFHHRHRKLYIFGGQRNKEYTTEFQSYDVDTQEVTTINNDHNNTELRKMPPSGFTQRATIDCERDEIYVLSSLSKEKERRDFNLNSFWMYSLRTNQWTCIYRCDHSAEQCLTKAQYAYLEPCPRYAHQLVYDYNTKVHYLFGGNPGKNTSPQLRLDDFWILHLLKPSRHELLQHCQYLIRKLEYEEIAKVNPIEAMQYLQTRLSEIIDHSDPNALRKFHKLAAVLFKDNKPVSCTSSSNTMDPAKEGQRTEHAASTASVAHHNYAKCSTTVCCFGGKATSLCSKPTPSAMFLNPKDDMMLLSNKLEESQYDTKTQRCVLFNKIVELLPDHMVQPKHNLSDLSIMT